MHMKRQIDIGTEFDTRVITRGPQLDSPTYNMRINTKLLGPEFPSGATVVVDPCAEVRPGDIVYAVFGQENEEVNERFFEWYDGALNGFDKVRAIHKVVEKLPST